MLTKMKIALVMCASLAGIGIAAASPLTGQTQGAPSADVAAKWQAKRAEKKAEMLAKFDTNKDGKLDEQERAVMRDQKSTERFQKMDLDKNGSISIDEFKQFSAKKGGHHARGGKRHHRGGLTK
jgi:beta-N-acetylglucosaminidase